MPNPRLSYLEITARDSYPTIGRGLDTTNPLHLWEPTLQTLARQTFKDFEYICIDVYWEDRPDYFKEHDYGLRIKHVPPMPNPWQKLNLAQSCIQFNTGVVHADGELLFLGADSGMYPPWFMEKVWQLWKEGGRFVTSGFGADASYVPAEKRSGFAGITSTKAGVPTDWYRFLGFDGEVYMDHRYQQLFEGTNEYVAPVQPQWFYGISSVSLEAMLKVNGFDEAFNQDGCKLADCDLGQRLAMAGYGRMDMCRDVYCVEAYAGSAKEKPYHPKMRHPLPEVVCAYGLHKFNELRGRWRANEPLSDGDVEWIQRNVCNGACEIMEKCKEVAPWRAPFWNIREPVLYDVWRKYISENEVSLVEERGRRLNGEYGEGTFINC